MNYRNKIEDRVRTYSNPGSMIRDILAPKLDSKGNRIIVKKDQENLYASIQSYADQCDINYILTRYMDGDETVLLKKVGEFMDTTNIPDNISDLFNLTVEANDIFNHLPIDVKEKFGNNVYNFASNMGTPEWNEIMNTSERDIKNEKIRDMQENIELNKKLKSAITKENIVIENPAVDSEVIKDE